MQEDCRLRFLVGYKITSIYSEGGSSYVAILFLKERRDFTDHAMLPNVCISEGGGIFTDIYSCILRAFEDNTKK
jgi:hypothetical protein